MKGLSNRALRVYRSCRDVARHPIHSGRRLSSVIDWIRIDRRRKAACNGMVQIPYVDDTVLLWSAPFTSITICARYGLGEYEDMAFMLHLLRPDDVLCDVGANAGVYTVLAAGAVGCQVIAVEPVPSSYDMLIQNVKGNGIEQRVDARQVGMGREAGRLNFTSRLGSFNHVVSDSDSDSVEVEVDTLDHLIGDRSIMAMKIDVEGFESEVLAGGRSALQSSSLQAVLIEVAERHAAHFGVEVDAITKALHAAGLVGPFWYEPQKRRLVRGSQANIPGRHINRKFNQIFVRDEAFVADRLKTSRCYKVHGRLV